MLGTDSFSDFAAGISSGVSPYTPIETAASGILNTLIEQLRYEKAGTAGAYPPVRVFVDGDKKGMEMLFDECLVEDAVDKNSEFPYSDFLSMLHKRIRATISNV